VAQNGQCAFCGESGPLVKAHAIPRAFFNISPQDSENALKLITNKEGVHPKKAPIGVYDAEILCQRCEDSFSEVDSYAAGFLLQSPDSFRPIPNVEKPAGFEVDSYDYSRLKRFCMAVLWRAAVSDHEFYTKVRLGGHEQRLREMLRASDAGKPDEFATVLGIYDSNPVSTIILDPHRERCDGVNCYRFKLHRYQFWIKVDRRQFPEGVRETQISEQPPLLVLYFEFLGSRDHRRALKLVRDIAWHTKK
jgi:hypothetical protein